MKTQYIILTGSKNNSGDYLIKYRAKQLFSWLRPDRKLHDIDGWIPFTSEVLELVNNSRALILMGGPALQPGMYPTVYPLIDDLSKITVPIITMGIGWHSLSGDWKDSQNYSFHPTNKRLLDVIEKSGFISSVRDYHTLNALNNNGYTNYLMTGCPALYDKLFLGGPFKPAKEIKKIGFSMGVSFLKSYRMEKQIKEAILELKECYSSSEFVVVFHHSISDAYLKTHNAKRNHLNKHKKFIQWLEENNISYIDISGSAENLIDFYSSCDFHAGYRVHAHIFMTSISKPSILIAEDGRAKGLRDVIGGVILDGFSCARENLLYRVLRKTQIADGMDVLKKIPTDLSSILNYETEHDFPRLRSTRKTVDNSFDVMRTFIKSLP